MFERCRKQDAVHLCHLSDVERREYRDRIAALQRRFTLKCARCRDERFVMMSAASRVRDAPAQRRCNTRCRRMNDRIVTLLCSHVRGRGSDGGFIGVRMSLEPAARSSRLARFANRLARSATCAPGHEVVGRVTKVGRAVRNFKEGDLAGVGCMVDSCRSCVACREGQEQFCDGPATFTYNSPDKHLGGVTYGGYSESLVVDEGSALRVSDQMDPAGCGAARGRSRPRLLSSVAWPTHCRRQSRVGAGPELAQGPCEFRPARIPVTR